MLQKRVECFSQLLNRLPIQFVRVKSPNNLEQYEIDLELPGLLEITSVNVNEISPRQDGILPKIFKSFFYCE